MDAGKKRRHCRRDPDYYKPESTCVYKRLVMFSMGCPPLLTVTAHRRFFDPMMGHTAYISVGSNIGDKLLHCQNGIAAMTHSGASTMMDQSRFYLTEPVDYPLDYMDRDWFVNGVVKIQTDHDPFQLLSELLSIQLQEGRRETRIRFGPRVLDLDILFYDDLVMNRSELVIPHPRMHKRRFVLQPICDIDPGVMHPILKKSMRQLLSDLHDKTNDNVQGLTDCP
ncbi:2-amino-4-hydroxy-6-hydroxymethyldihydropteridine diphosphokinase [Thermodesulfobacteriota bacterium]